MKLFNIKRLVCLAVTLLLCCNVMSLFAQVPNISRETWSWVNECQARSAIYKKNHGGNSTGIVCHFGDSITYASPYSSWARNGEGQTPEDVAVLKWMHVGGHQGPTDPGPTITNKMPDDCAAVKAAWGQDGWWLAYVDMSYNGSYTARSGINTEQFLDGGHDLPPVNDMMNCYDPEIAVVMLGTNDGGQKISASNTQNYLDTIVTQMLYPGGNTSGSQRGCIPILTTLSPSANFDVTPYNAAIVSVATKYNLPLIDFYSEVQLRQPGTPTSGAWLGTLINPLPDGTHPTASGGNFTASSNPYTDNYAALAQVGYLLRCFITVKKIEDVKSKCIDAANGGNTAPAPNPGQ